MLNLSVKSKRSLLVFHILFAAIMFGNMVAFLIFSITMAASGDKTIAEACYKAMDILANSSVKASTIGTAVTGILLSVWTKWGLFKYYWIIVKEGLTFLSIVLNLWVIHALTEKALRFVQANGRKDDLFVVQTELWTWIIIQILSIVFMYVISVYKPWGKREVRKAS